MQADKTDRRTVLEILRVRHAFGGLLALQDVSCKVYENQILALIGPNGAGKTTLLNVVAGNLRPTSGVVLLDGQALNGRSTSERVRLGIVRTFQQALLFEGMSVLDNVTVGAHLRGRAGLVASALRTTGMRQEEEDLSLEGMRYLNLVGLGGKAQEEATYLPFGQQRLLAIARALAARPRVLLLDEPAAGLNQLERNGLAELILRVRDMGTTIVLVEHDMGLVMRLADWVVVLDHGKLIAQGPPEEVRRNRDVIEAYLGDARNDA